MHSLKKKTILILFLSTVFFLTGCQPVAQLYIGNVYKDAKTFPLDVSETTPVTLETFEMKTSFDYRTSGTVFSISGTASLGGHYQTMYGRVKVIDLFLFFLDDNNYVIDGTRLYNAVNAFPEDTFRFNQEMTVPAGATQIALGYEATLSSADSRETAGGGEWIYRVPLSSRK